MGKKLLLISPVNRRRIQFQDFRYAKYQPISLGIIASLTPKHWEIELIDENFEKFSYREADLVGITGVTPSANRAYEIAAFYRSEGIPTVMGGIHASLLPDEALNFVDTVVIGEAESVWEKVIADFETCNLQKKYRGKLLPMTGAPFPRRDLFDPRYPLASIQTTRGCPMHCDFCSVSVFNGRKYRKRPVEEVLDELQQIKQPRMFFVDDNLAGNGREDEERAISLFKGMIKRNLNKRWFCQTSLNVADNDELLYYASKCGCRMMLIGIESEKRDALLNLGKTANLKMVEKYNEFLKKINSYGIAVLGGMIFGSDTDTVEDLYSRAKFMKKSRIDVMQTTLLTPYPGTKVYDKLRESDRLLYTDYPEDWDRYDMTDVLFKPALMEPKELKTAMNRCFLSLFNFWNIFIKAVKTLIYTRHPAAAYWSLNTNIIYRGIFMKRVNEQDKEET